MSNSKLGVMPLGLALGILSAACMFIITIFAMYGYGTSSVDLVAEYYIGYSATWGGAFLGAIYGFIDGFIGGVVLAWLYNKLS